MSENISESGSVDDAAFFDNSMEWTKWHWLAAFAFPLTVAPLWAYFAPADPSAARSFFFTMGGCTLVAALVVASYTDLRWRLIPNWVAYPAILFGLGFNLVDYLTGAQYQSFLGGVGILNSFVGFMILFTGLLMVVVMSGGGAGDVKLVGAIGAFMGFIKGAESLCLAFVLCAVVVIFLSLLRMGPFRVVGAGLRKVGNYMFHDWVKEPDEDQDTLLKAKIPQGPFFALGTILVMVRDTVVENPEPFQFLSFN